MLKLKTINKDRRYKLSEQDKQNILEMWQGFDFTMKEIAGQFKISRQRVSQIIDRNGTEEARIKSDARKFLYKYRNNKKFREKIMQLKKESYIYKTKTLKDYEQEKKDYATLSKRLGGGYRYQLKKHQNHSKK